MADPPADITAQIFDPSPAQSQRVFGEHYPWIYTFTGEDVLELTSWNSAAGVRIVLQGRVHAAPGVIIPFAAVHVPATDRTPVTTVHTVPLGELLNAIVYCDTGSPFQSQTFVRVAVRRGAGNAFTRLGVIIQGAITAVSARSFPGSAIVSSLESEPFIRHIVGTAPGAGLNITETVPNGARWEVLTFYAAATWSGVAGNRTPYLVMSSNSVNVGTFACGGATPAASVVSCTWGQALNTGADNTNHQYQGAVPGHLTLVAGSVIQTAVFGFAAGDAWGNPQYTVREWIDV